MADGATGWGEVTAGETPGYNAETTDTAWHVISDFLVPCLLGKNMATASEVPGLLTHIRGHEMAKSGMENALWDAEAHLKGVSLSTLLGGKMEEIVCGVSLGIREDPASLVKKVEEELRSGYQRIKLKIKPGKDDQFVAAVRKEYPDIRLSVDANSAYTLDDAAHLKRFDDFELLMMEQPLGWDVVSTLSLPSSRHRSRRQFAWTNASTTPPMLFTTAIELKSCRIINIKLRPRRRPHLKRGGCKRLKPRTRGPGRCGVEGCWSQGSAAPTTSRCLPFPASRSRETSPPATAIGMRILSNRQSKSLREVRFACRMIPPGLGYACATRSNRKTHGATAELECARPMHVEMGFKA